MDYFKKPRNLVIGIFKLKFWMFEILNHRIRNKTARIYYFIENLVLYLVKCHQNVSVDRKCQMFTIILKVCQTMLNNQRTKVCFHFKWDSFKLSEKRKKIKIVGLCWRRSLSPLFKMSKMRYCNIIQCPNNLGIKDADISIHKYDCLILFSYCIRYNFSIYCEHFYYFVMKNTDHKIRMLSISGKLP